MSLSKDRSKNDVLLTKSEAMGICDLCEAYFNEKILPYLHAYSLGGKEQYMKSEVLEVYFALALVKAPTKKITKRRI